MTDKLKASFSPRSNNALNLDALQLLKASSTNLQLNKMASNKQIPMLNSFIQHELRSVMKSPKSGAVQIKQTKTADNDLCKKLLDDNKESIKKIKKLENTIAFLVETLNYGQTLYQNLAQKYQDLKKAYLQHNDFSMSFEEIDNFRKSMVKEKIAAFPNTKNLNPLRKMKSETKLDHLNQLMLKSQIKQERSRIEQIQYTQFCKNCLNKTVKMSNELNDELLDVFEMKIEESNSKPIFKPEKTKRVTLNKVGRKKSSDDENKDQDCVTKSKQSLLFKRVDESMVANSSQLQKIREYIKVSQTK